MATKGPSTPLLLIRAALIWMCVLEFLPLSRIGASGITTSQVQRFSIQHSLNFQACSEGPRSDRLARVVSDRSTFGYLTDVFCAWPEHRGQGLANGWSAARVLPTPSLQGGFAVGCWPPRMPKTPLRPLWLQTPFDDSGMIHAEVRTQTPYKPASHARLPHNDPSRAGADPAEWGCSISFVAGVFALLAIGLHPPPDRDFSAGGSLACAWRLAL